LNMDAARFLNGYQSISDRQGMWHTKILFLFRLPGSQNRSAVVCVVAAVALAVGAIAGYASQTASSSLYAPVNKVDLYIFLSVFPVAFWCFPRQDIFCYNRNSCIFSCRIPRASEILFCHPETPKADWICVKLQLLFTCFPVSTGFNLVTSCEICCPGCTPPTGRCCSRHQPLICNPSDRCDGLGCKGIHLIIFHCTADIPEQSQVHSQASNTFSSYSIAALFGMAVGAGLMALTRSQVFLMFCLTALS